MKKLSYLFIFLFSLSLVTTSCREEKNTSDDVEEAMEDLGDDLEEAGDDIEDAAEEIEEEMENDDDN